MARRGEGNGAGIWLQDETGCGDEGATLEHGDEFRVHGIEDIARGLRVRCGMAKDEFCQGCDQGRGGAVTGRISDPNQPGAIGEP